MKSRLGFSVSIHIDPEILILDEVLSVGDELFQRKCYTKIENLFEKGRTVLYVSHNLQSILEICNRAIVLKDGELLYDGAPDKAVKFYRNLNNNSIHFGSERKVIEIEQTQKVDTRFYNKALYDERLISKSTELIVKKGIIFSEYMIIDKNNKKVNVLERCEDYKILFKVRFTEDIYKARIGVKNFFEQKQFN